MGPLSALLDSNRSQRFFGLLASFLLVKLPNGVTNVYVPLGRPVSPPICTRWNVIWSGGAPNAPGAVAASTLKKMLTVPPGTFTSTAPPHQNASPSVSMSDAVAAPTPHSGAGPRQSAACAPPASPGGPGYPATPPAPAVRFALAGTANAAAATSAAAVVIA